MMKNVLIVGLVLLIGVGLFFTFYEYTDVSDYSWDHSYHPVKDDPYDISAFTKIIHRQYPESRKLVRHRDVSLSDLDTIGNLMIYVGDRFNDYTDNDTSSSLIDWVARGNAALIVANSIYIQESYAYRDIYTSTTRNDSVINIEYCRSNLGHDQFFPYHHTEQKWHYSYSQSFNESDSLLLAEEVESLISTDKSSVAMLKIEIDSGTLYLHSIPVLYSNYALQQNFYKNHLNYTLDLLPVAPPVIVLDNDIYSKFSQDSSQSPLRFILSKPSLRWAYYLTLIATLLYLFFRGKRKHKPVPVLHEPENSSINYAETLAVLYASQDQNQDLIKHLEELFYHRVKEKYFILKDDPDFSEKLSRKSHFPLEKINAIRSHFSAIESKSTINDHQLGIIYGRLEDFHNHDL